MLGRWLISPSGLVGVLFIPLIEDSLLQHNRHAVVNPREPDGMIGLAVPGKPVGSPGINVIGNVEQPPF